MNSEKIIELIKQHQHLEGALLPILHAIQEHFGYIPPESLALLAQYLQQTEAEIYGVISFYDHFRLTPSGTHLLEICRGEACQAMGAWQLEQAAKDYLHIDYQQTSKDNSITLAPVYCLGNCACAPSVKVADKVYGRMTNEKLQQLIDKLSRYAITLSTHDKHSR